MLVALFLACPASEPTPPAAEPAAQPAELEAPEEPEVSAQPVEPTPIPPGIPSTVEPVALIGHGIRLTLNPPFQAAWMGNLEGEGAMVLAWWDVAAEKAGQIGAAGLYNVSIMAAPVPEGEPVIQQTTVLKREKTLHALQLGESGTLLQLPEGHNALGGMGSVEPGPAHAEWKVQVGDREPMDWPERDMLHSWDPADGGPAKFQQKPSRPWGPWPEPPTE